jgi:hypothetical protein
MEDTIIKLPCHGIEVTLVDQQEDGSWGGATITSELKVVCECCSDPSCNFDCPNAMEDMSDRDKDAQRLLQEEITGNRIFNSGMDAIESMVMAHASEGVDIESTAYICGIETAVDAVGNNTD